MSLMRFAAMSRHGNHIVFGSKASVINGRWASGSSGKGFELSLGCIVGSFVFRSYSGYWSLHSHRYVYTYMWGFGFVGDNEYRPYIR